MEQKPPKLLRIRTLRGLWRRFRAPVAGAPAFVGQAGRTPADWLAEAPFSLALSAGFFGFFTHTGFLCALEEAKLRPRQVSGTSAGAITGGLWAAGYSGEALTQVNQALRPVDFWDDDQWLPGLLPGRKLQATFHGLLASVGVELLEDCPLPFAAVTFDLLRRTTRVLRQGPMATALRASAALPGMFRPVRFGGSYLCDGGVLDRGAHQALAPTERALLHHIPSTSTVHKVTSGGPLPNAAHRITLQALPAPRIDPRTLAGAAAAQEVAYNHTRAWLRGCG